MLSSATAALLTATREKLARFTADRRANIAIIAAITLPIMLFTVGIGADYTFAGRRQVQMNAIADAAALTAVTQTVMTQNSQTAQYFAYTMFVSQAAKVLGVSFSPANLIVTVNDTSVGNHLQRQVFVSYAAQSLNNFASIIGKPTLNIAGKAAATSSSALNIDFYLLLDTSPSMLIAATPQAINQMMSLTVGQDMSTGNNGCAFACHQSSPYKDANGNLYNGNGEDNLKLARANSIPLRFDYVLAATSGNGGLMDTAAAAEQSNHATYRMATYKFDFTWQKVNDLTSDLNSGSSSSAKSMAAGIQPLLVYGQQMLTSTNTNNDGDTDFDDAMVSMNNAMPSPGTGTTGSSPQEILFIVSDGLIDEDITSNGAGTYNANARFMAAVDQYQQRCTTIKNRGIRIAFLYTTYNPLPTNSFYNGNISGYQAQIGSKYAQACASPGLYTEVTANGDITSALNNLFSKATATAHLTE